MQLTILLILNILRQISPFAHDYSYVIFAWVKMITLKKFKIDFFIGNMLIYVKSLAEICLSKISIQNRHCFIRAILTEFVPVYINACHRLKKSKSFKKNL